MPTCEWQDISQKLLEDSSAATLEDEDRLKQEVIAYHGVHTVRLKVGVFKAANHRVFHA